MPQQSTESPAYRTSIIGIGVPSQATRGWVELSLNCTQSTPSSVIVAAQEGQARLADIQACDPADAARFHIAQPGLPIQPNQVYLLPHDVPLTIQSERFEQVPSNNHLPTIGPIDRLFCDLANAVGEGAIAVLLHGEGDDGWLGLRTIKASNGITMVESSLATSSLVSQYVGNHQGVDFLLTWDALIQELRRIVALTAVEETPPSLLVLDKDEESDAAYLALFRLLRSVTHIDYANYKRSTVRRRIHRRMLLHNLKSIEDYARFVANNAGEVWALHRDMLIHVTRFFREPTAFESLKTTIFPEICAKVEAGTPIRIWVPGCSTGEEAYSIAMSLLETLGERAAITPIRIFATDVSEDTLNHARTGIYASNIVAHVSEERLQRFFHPVNQGYQINKSLRELCVFARHDMTNDPPFSNLDLISCRNVMIYLGPILQKRVLPLFHYALRSRRYLLLGGSETIGGMNDFFELLDPTNRIYQSKPTPKRVSFDFSATGSVFSDGLRSIPVPSDLRGFQELKSEVDRVLLNHYAPAGVVVDHNGDILQFRGQTGNYLTPAPGNASLNLLKMAREGLWHSLRTCLENSRTTGHVSQTTATCINEPNRTTVRIQVVPLQFSQRPCFAVLFSELEPSSPSDSIPPQPPSQTPLRSLPQDDEQLQISKLHQELEATKEFLQSTIEELESSNEELKAANEEILSSNEELQSTNEELQTAKEELQASNEELQTVNDELHQRNREATKLGDDLHNLLRSVNIPMIMVGPDLCIRRFTPSASGVLNLIPSDLGRPIADLNSKLVGVRLEEWMADVLENLNVVEHEAQDQEGRWYRVTIRPYRTFENVIDGVVLSVVDIDGIKQSASRSRESRDFAEAVLSATHVPMVVLDHDWRPLAHNKAFARLFELSSAESDIRFFDESENPTPDIPFLHQILTQALDTDGLAVDRTVHFQEGSHFRILLVNSQSLSISSGSSKRLVSIEDITDRQNASAYLQQESIKESSKLESIGRLAGGIAHDFNNLLTVINGYCELLIQRLKGNPELISLAEQILSAGQSATSLTTQLLAYGRKQILQPRRIDLNRLLSDKEPLIGRLLHENIHLSLRLCMEPTWVFIDPNQMEQVLLNLCINARDAMPDGGELILETCFLPQGLDGTSQIRLRVIDSGIGMSSQTLANIFEPFFTTKHLGHGTGLGLSTVFGIIHQSQGTIEATSQLGAGACFTIHLPAIEESSIDANLAPKEHEVHAKATILIVEDEKSIRDLQWQILSEEGFRILQAEDGESALQQCGTYSDAIHLLITDVIMPGMNGYQLAQALRSFRPNLQILYVSGHSEDLVRRQGIQLEDEFFVKKPFRPADLIAKVKDILQ